MLLAISPLGEAESLIRRSVSDLHESRIVISDSTLDRYVGTNLSTLSVLEVDIFDYFELL